jgi:hypothetical protein
MAAAGMVIPVSERCGKLKEVVFKYVELLASIRTRRPNLTPQKPTTFLFLAYPWLADEQALIKDQKAVLARNRDAFRALGFNGEEIKNDLEGILAQDKHLLQCCPTPLHLANYLDLSLIAPLATAKLAGLSQDKLDFSYLEFESSTYHQGPFKRILLTHLFNFDMEGNSSIIGDVRIERLGPETIVRILGESGPQAFLHPSKIGNCFIVEEEGEGVSSLEDTAWMVAKRDKAIRFGQLLQYYKDGVVYTGYSAPYFSPEWANHIRKWGLFFLGSTSQLPYEQGSKPYIMTAADRDRLGLWWGLIRTPRIASALDSKSGKLRAATYRAAEYYEVSHQRSGPAERLVALAIAMESLFSPSDKGELRFRIAQSAAQFVGRDVEERKKIFASLKQMYDKRSALFHGSYDLAKYEQGAFVSAEQIDEWSSYIRRAYLAFLTLYLRGETSRDDILELIGETSFDSTLGEELRRRANVEVLIEELRSQAGNSAAPDPSPR